MEEYQYTPDPEYDGYVQAIEHMLGNHWKALQMSCQNGSVSELLQLRDKFDGVRENHPLKPKLDVSKVFEEKSELEAYQIINQLE